MKRWMLVLILINTIIFSVSLCQVQLPNHMGKAVNDFADVIEPDDEQQMEVLAREVLQKTGAAIVVATIENMEGLSEEEYAVQLFQKWGIGQSGEDKGLLILLALEERRVRIEVGYGFEGLIPDGLAGEILDQYALPDFQSGAYGRGLYRSMLAAADIIAKDAGVQITGTQNMVRRSTSEREGGGLGGIFMILVFIFLMIVTRGRILPWILLGMLSGGRGGGFKGGGFGGGFGGFGGGMSGGGGASRGF